MESASTVQATAFQPVNPKPAAQRIPMLPITASGSVNTQCWELNGSRR